MAVRKHVIHTGDRFEKLIVVDSEPTKEEKPLSLKSRRAVKVQCDCGKLFYTTPSKLVSKHTISCGCEGRRKSVLASTTHGACAERLFHIWRRMVARCENPKDVNYIHYGGRGITVCSEWRSDFYKFNTDMIPTYKEGLTLERVDVNKGYCPENVIWADMSVQSHNKRKQGGTTSQYMGVFFYEKNKKFTSYINNRKLLDKRVYLLYHECEDFVAKAYDDASMLLFNDRPNKTQFVRDWIYDQVIQKLKDGGWKNAKG